MAWHHFVAYLVVALALGAVIGAERQWHQRIAGLRTNALVSAGAAGTFCRSASAYRSILVCTFFLAIAVSTGSGQSEILAIQRMVREPASDEGSVGADRSKYDDSQRLKANADLVLVPVTVTDQRDRIVVGLEKDNFRIYDEREPQIIRHISTDDVPVSLGIIFDISSSMYRKLERSREAVIQLLRRGNAEDEFFLILFNNRPAIVTDFTRSVDDIENDIARARPEGLTSLLDAVYRGLSEMRFARNERKILLIVSDGGDNHSRYTAREVLSSLAESNVQAYALGIFDDAPRTSAERGGPDLLVAMTNIGGGRTLRVRNLKNIGEAVSELSVELHNQYLLAYRPTNLTHDGRWHRIRVQVAPPPKSPRLRVHAKTGYYAADE